MSYLKLFAVRNKDGKWFRSKGREGYGDNWVDDLKNARIYTKIGPARSVVSWWANNSSLGIPELVVLHINELEVIDETDRVTKQKAKKEENEKKWELRNKEYRFKQAQRRLLETQEEVERLKKELN